MTTNRYRFIDEPDAKGKPQHLHTLDGKPLIGTSTALSVLAKPLTWWASGMAVKHLGWVPQKYDGTQKRVPIQERLTQMIETGKYGAVMNMSPEEYLICLDEAYKAHSVKLDTSAEAGTDMHGWLEDYIKQCIEENNGEPFPVDSAPHQAVLIFAKWAMENVSLFLGSEVHCYSEKNWTGGIVDLIYEDEAGRLILLDFKSAKEAYFAHFVQNAGYDIAIAENGILDKEGNLLRTFKRDVKAYGVFPFGMKEPEPAFRSDTENLKGGFRACVFLHKLMKGAL